MKKTLRLGMFVLGALGLLTTPAQSDIGTTPQDYRNLILNIRKKMNFKVPHIAGDIPFSYDLKWDHPQNPLPKIIDAHLYMDHPEKFFRDFIDRIFTTSDSIIKVGSDEMTLTCVVVFGKDSRFSPKPSVPTTRPPVWMEVYIVANDLSCVGPMNPNYPFEGHEETWENYITFRINDPTTMLPEQIRIRYRDNDYNALPVNP